MKKKKSKEVCCWLEVSYRCRIPVNDAENMPSGCDPKCPARLQNENRANARNIESRMMMYS